MERSRRILEGYRVQRKELVELYAGGNWHGSERVKPAPVNLLSLYVQIVSRSLIAKDPRVMLSTMKKEYQPTVAAMQAWGNTQIELMGLGETFKRVVIDALFWAGFVKVAIAKPEEAALYGFQQQAGRVMCSRIDPDDIVLDMHAKDWRQLSYCGHRVRVPLEVVRDSKFYGKARKDLQASDPSPYNREGDERIGALGLGQYQSDSEELEDMVDLWEVYVPRHRCVYTLACDGDSGMPRSGDGGTDKPLLEQEWVGPDSGPIRMLGYGTVPGNLLPKGPMSDLRVLHEAVNRHYRKIIAQGDRMKEIAACRGSADADGNRVVQAGDGEMVRVDDPMAIKMLQFGGANPALVQLAIHLKDVFSFMGGNLEMKGGLSPQSKTATQDRMLNENASMGQADMQDTTTRWAADVLGDILWFWHNDPEQVQTSLYQTPGFHEISANRSVYPARHQDPQAMRRTFSLAEMAVKIDPYSMQHWTPQSRLQALSQIVTQTIAPMLPILQAQGVQFDINAYLQKIAQYLDLPDLAELVVMREPPADAAMGEGEKPGMPQNTNREYTRHNVSERTEKGSNAALMMSAAGQDPGGASDEAA